MYHQGSNMAVPDFQTLMRPVLAALEDGRERAISDIRDDLAVEFELSEDDLRERIPSGRVPTFQNRVGWATTYLYRTGLLDRPRRAVYALTDRGRQVLNENPDRVDLSVLAQFDELDELRHGKAAGAEASAERAAKVEADTPEERLERAHRELNSALAAELMEQVQQQTPEFFEQLVLDVLLTMGYGGSREDAAERLGRSGDEGIDGIVREDRLGLNVIYLQAKRWANPVGRPGIQNFMGAMEGQGATKGVFITTSTFATPAKEYVERATTKRVVLIDGERLANLMIEFGVGVTVDPHYEVKRIALD
jgi:restriction system protein